MFASVPAHTSTTLLKRCERMASRARMINDRYDFRVDTKDWKKVAFGEWGYLRDSQGSKKSNGRAVRLDWWRKAQECTDLPPSACTSVQNVHIDMLIALVCVCGHTAQYVD
jgi:hypothetical protein